MLHIKTLNVFKHKFNHQVMSKVKHQGGQQLQKGEDEATNQEREQVTRKLRAATQLTRRHERCPGDVGRQIQPLAYYLQHRDEVVVAHNPEDQDQVASDEEVHEDAALGTLEKKKERV